MVGLNTVHYKTCRYKCPFNETRFFFFAVIAFFLICLTFSTALLSRSSLLLGGLHFHFLWIPSDDTSAPVTDDDSLLTATARSPRSLSVHTLWHFTSRCDATFALFAHNDTSLGLLPAQSLWLSFSATCTIVISDVLFIKLSKDNTELATSESLRIL